MTLSRQDTALLKGVAILMIALHNFCHWLPMAVIENEYQYDATRIWKLMSYYEALRPHVLLNTLSHFGHYGVPLFLFLSGYGLVKKHEREGANHLHIGRFLWHNAQKLWWIMLPAIGLFILGEELLREGFQHDSLDLFRMVSYTTNFFPTGRMMMGPWWFFSLIMQFYLLYALFFWRWRNHTLLWGSTLFTLAFQVWLYMSDLHFTWEGREIYALEYVRYNAVGHLLPFALGIAYARREWQFPPLLMAMAGTLLTFGAAFRVELWWFSPLFAVMALLPLARLIPEGKIRHFLMWVGPISAAVFAFHPVVRQHLILAAGRAVRMDEPSLVYGSLLLYIMVCLALAWGYTQILNRLKR
ncbi:MAG: acyltransferase family protein [Bacteroidales bacterium]|nr:acyltransferase family protein [Bacteroidales bacterium]